MHGSERITKEPSVFNFTVNLFWATKRFAEVYSVFVAVGNQCWLVLHVDPKSNASTHHITRQLMNFDGSFAMYLFSVQAQPSKAQNPNYGSIHICADTRLYHCRIPIPLLPLSGAFLKTANILDWPNYFEVDCSDYANILRSGLKRKRTPDPPQ